MEEKSNFSILFAAVEVFHETTPNSPMEQAALEAMSDIFDAVAQADIFEFHSWLWTIYDRVVTSEDPHGDKLQRQIFASMSKHLDAVFEVWPRAAVDYAGSLTFYAPSEKTFEDWKRLARALADSDITHGYEPVDKMESRINSGWASSDGRQKELAVAMRAELDSRPARTAQTDSNVGARPVLEGIGCGAGK